MNAVAPPLDIAEPKTVIRVLLVEDDEDDYMLTRALVSARENANIKLDWVDSYDRALSMIGTNAHDVYLVDYRLGHQTGTNLIQEAFLMGCRAPMILLTGQDDLTVDQSALELGAADYLVKGRIDAQLLGRSIRYALRQASVLAEVAQKENKYRSLFERSIDAIFVANNEMHFQDANPSVERLLGYSRDELRQLNPARLFADLNCLRELRFNVREHGQIKDFEAVLITKNKRKRICLISVWAVDDVVGRPEWYQGIVRDVTDQKRAQQDLILAEKLTMTGKIARSIAHEVRNPLTNLSLALEQLKDELDTDSEYITMFTDIIGRNVDRIGQLITEMLNSSKPRELDRKRQDFNVIVKSTLQLVADRIKLKRMRLETSFDTNDCAALLDSDQVKTALLNILVNAVEAMEEGKGILTVRTGSTEDNRVYVEVADNGGGISDADRQRLFDPFFTGKSGGMGLGLTATQNIINSHKGSIEVDSLLGQGTTFKLYFPR
ncbi:hybrid sensor histidine kinase/response regulator [Spirosoma utsteinense]|uniref:histidine kinase n=1 Tax=Spirosoma utsteinense TaxID=2585773 RepID=A0ABR6W674_9BACT|nr:hybrid sensor histidine kinase/response regulator [Spirosoma utsteinense]MBC3786394.1 PAS domain S-box-containing protein [Spirosoma utsteinense]MBC3791442.1 PAS domain S-box-containing protein [Spirosoma utsteinense]